MKKFVIAIVLGLVMLSSAYISHDNMDPNATDTHGLGTKDLRWADLFVGDVNANSVYVTGDANIAGTLDVHNAQVDTLEVVDSMDFTSAILTGGNIDIGALNDINIGGMKLADGAITDSSYAIAFTDTNIYNTAGIWPNSDATYDLGLIDNHWRDAYISRQIMGLNGVKIGSAVHYWNFDDTNSYIWNTTASVGIGTATPTAYLHLGAGTADANTAPLKLTAGTFLTTPEAGAIEYDGDHFTITNLTHRKVIDRTSDVIVDTNTVANDANEITIWTGPMDANSLAVGCVFKLHADGIVSNNGPAGADQITMRVKVGGVTKATLTPTTKTLTNAMWHLDANATQRTLGVAGSRAIHLMLTIGLGSTGDTVGLSGIAPIDTTSNMDVTVTVQWASAKAANTISLYQGFMEYKN